MFATPSPREGVAPSYGPPPVAHKGRVGPVIASTHNKRIQDAVRLRRRGDRDETRTFLIEGPTLLLEAVRAGASVLEVFHAFDGRRDDPGVEAAVEAALASGARVERVTEAVLARVASTVTPHALVAVVGFVDVTLDRIGADAGLVPVLIEVRDPGNVGTILRSADAAGAGAVILTTGSVDIYNPKAVRASAGSLFHRSVVREAVAREAVAHLREAGFAVVAATADGEVSLYDADFTRPTAVLFGNEAHGLSEEARGLADVTMRVPIRGAAESLNLAAAAAVVFFEVARRRDARDGRNGSVHSRLR